MYCIETNDFLHIIFCFFTKYDDNVTIFTKLLQVSTKLNFLVSTLFGAT